jgi:8-oxo-dGTP pyrophosphatase MutT (NUDIX family)
VNLVKSSHQIAALPIRKRRGHLEVLLITSRETKRWIIPKGWPMTGLLDYNAAKREALEEAGVDGRISKTAIGHYSYDKVLKSGALRHCTVQIYLLRVAVMHRNWLEKHQRQRKWVSLAEAQLRIQEPDLREVIASLDA